MNYLVRLVIGMVPVSPSAWLAALLALGLTGCDRGQQSPGEATLPTAGQEQSAPAGGQAQPEKPGMQEMDHAAMGHDEHMMTPEQFAELRAKIPLYKDTSDEAIMKNMGRMPPDWWAVLSSDDLQGDVGVLALGHGYTLGGNEQFENYAEPLSKEMPTAVAPGMAMMSSSHIQDAVDALTREHGVKTIVVIPMEPGDDSSLIHQWQYIFGLRDQAPYLTVPQVKTDAKVVFTKSPAAASLTSRIMRDYAIEAASDPAAARLILVSHGPETPEANPAELALLQMHADAIASTTEFKDIKVLSLQDDAIPPIRAANLETLRGYIKEATDQGREVVVVPMILTKGGFHARLQKDLEGLDYTFVNKGLIEHPAFQDWIRQTVADALAR